MSGQESSDEEEVTLLEEPTERLEETKKTKKNRATRRLLVVSIFVNFCFAAYNFILPVYIPRVVIPSYENGFDTDLETARSAIELIQRRFTGGVEVDQNGNFHTSQSPVQYTGTPSPEVDHAWNTLLLGLNIDLEGSHGNLQGRTFQWPESGLYFSGLEVFHSLHCLDRLRQALYPDYYDIFSDPDNPDREDHISHCINHIRQALECHADLTPMEWKRSGHKIILNTATQHTCRNFDKIREWAVERRTHVEKIESLKNGSLVIVD